MIHPIRCTIDVDVDDEEYQSQGPVDQLADGSLDAKIVLAFRLQAAVSNVEGLRFRSIQTERLIPLPSP